MIGPNNVSAETFRSRSGIDTLGQRRLDRSHLDSLAKVDFDLRIRDLGDLADQAAAGDDAVTLLHGGNLRLMLFHPLLLRTDQQEPEDDENQYQRNGLDEEACATRRRSRCSENGDIVHGPGNLFFE